MKIIPLIILLSFMISCVSSTAPEESTGGTNGGGTPVASAQTVTVPKVRVKNYNQYNMTLEKLTGLSRSNYLETFEAIKGSLPADNEIEGLTPFNLIAMTRLADAYCKDFVEREADTSLVNGLPRGRLAYDLNPLIVADVNNFLFSEFLDIQPGDRSYDTLRTEVTNVLNNDDGTRNVLLPGAATNNLVGNKMLTVAACVTILASPYITLLE